MAITQVFPALQRMHSHPATVYASGMARSRAMASMKIMIVDDHAEMRRLLHGLLEQAGREFVECADGLEAEQAFHQHQPAWTIMDVSMKGLDGLEATRRIRSGSPAARILILTQHDSAAMRRAARDAGACAFLSKDQLEQIESVLHSP